jgi:hypothetical protein
MIDVRGISVRNVRSPYRGEIIRDVTRGTLRREEELLLAKIELIILRIDELRAEAHADDKEIGRLGKETRRLIAKTQRELKAA